MNDLPEHKDRNPLDLMSDKIDEALVRTTAAKIVDIANTVPNIMTRMYEEDFVRNYLPLFYYDPDGVLNRKWLDISTSMMLGVVLVDKDDNEVYQVPPFMPTVLPTKSMQQLPVTQMSGDIRISLDNNRGYAAMNDINQLVTGLSNNTKLVDHDALWSAFYERYNEMISITDADGNDLMKPKQKVHRNVGGQIDF